MATIERMLCAVALFVFSAAAPAVDWGGVPVHEIVLFHPGQSSWEWMLTDHEGAEDIREGDACVKCHGEAPGDMGANAMESRELEPARSLPDPRGSFTARVQAAYDADRLYIRIRWPAVEALPDERQDERYRAKAALVLGDGALPEVERGGCWAGCHDDLRGMPSADPAEALTKYLIQSRTKITRHGGDAHYKDPAEIDKLRAQGNFLEYWQARLSPGNAPSIIAGYILEKRHVGDDPALRVEGGLSDGTWTVVMSRPLRVDRPGRRDIVPGSQYVIGFAVHDAYAGHRFHYVSLHRTFGLAGSGADLGAVKR